MHLYYGCHRALSLLPVRFPVFVLYGGEIFQSFRLFFLFVVGQKFDMQ